LVVIRGRDKGISYSRRALTVAASVLAKGWTWGAESIDDNEEEKETTTADDRSSHSYYISHPF